MRRATLIASLAIPAVLAAGAVLTALVPPQRLASLLEERFCTVRGVQCSIGSARLSVLPWPHISAQDVRVDLKGRPGVTEGRVLDLLGREWANSADITLTLPGTHKALSLNAAARWHGETVRLTVRVAQPFALAEGGPSDMLVGFTAPLMAASLEGIARAQPTPQISGTFTAASPNPAAFAAWIEEHPALLPVWPVSTSGTARLARGWNTRDRTV